MLHFTFNPEFTTPPVPPPIHPRRLWKLSHLKDKKYQQLFTENAGSFLQESQQIENQDYQPDFDSLYGSLCETIYTSLDQSVGTSLPPPRSAK